MKKVITSCLVFFSFFLISILSGCYNRQTEILIHNYAESSTEEINSLESLTETPLSTPRYSSQIGVGATAYDWFGQIMYGDPQARWDAIDPVPFLAEHGFNWLRAGVTTVDPTSMQWCSREYTYQVLKAGEKAGMHLYLFFYLSDKGAYVGNQKAPAGWEDYTLEETALALEQYTYETTKYYIEKGLHIELYEVGNEIDYGIAGYSSDTKLALSGVNYFKDFEIIKEKIWEDEAFLLKASIEGIKQADPEAKIVLHISPMEFPSLVKAFFQAMNDFSVPYDIAGLTYHPWIIPPDTGVAIPTDYFNQSVEAAAKAGKDVMIIEISYPSSKPTSLQVQEVPGYPFTPEGQACWVRDFLKTAENDTRIGSAPHKVDK